MEKIDSRKREKAVTSKILILQNAIEDIRSVVGLIEFKILLKVET
jgi:hypothetical protein